MKKRLCRKTSLPSQCGWMAAVVTAAVLGSCSEPTDGDKRNLFEPFGGDLYREIAADGGSMVLFDNDDVGGTQYYNWCYLIDKPLSYLDGEPTEAFQRMLDALYPGWIPDGVVNTRSLFAPHATTFVSPDGYDLDAISPDCTLYYPYDAYGKVPTAVYPWREEIPMYFDKDMAHRCTAAWCEIKFYKGKTTVTATPNDTGRERYLSLVYDYSNFPFICRGAVQLRQPAMQ